MPTPRISRPSTQLLSQVSNHHITTDPCANDQLVHEYLTYLRADSRPNTIRTRRSQFRVITRDLPAPLATATEQDIITWHDHLGGTPETRASYTSAMRGFYKWLTTRKRLRLDNPAAILERPRIPPAPPRPIVDRNYELALACAVANAEMYLWLGLMGCSGFRCCEIAWLRTSDIERRPDDSALAHIEGKGGKRRVVPIGYFLTMTLLPFLRGSGPVFTRPSDGKAYTPTAVSQKTNLFLHSLGITETAHQIRHRFGTDYHELDPDLFRQATIMGHASVNTTQRYTQVSPVEAARHIEQLTRRRFGRAS